MHTSLNVKHTNMKVLLLIATVLPFIAGQELIGGEQPYAADITDPQVVFALNAINEMNQIEGDPRHRVARQIISATVQVVSGVIYRFQIIVSGGDSKELCTVAVWSRPWLSGEDATKIEGTPICAPQPPPVDVFKIPVGGETLVSLSDPDVQNAVQFLESKLNAHSNSLFYLKLTGARKVTKQVVNGVIYRFFEATYAESVCTQKDVKQNPKKLCPVSASAQTLQTCNEEVYYNSRETEQYILNIEECGLLK